MERESERRHLPWVVKSGSSGNGPRLGSAIVIVNIAWYIFIQRSKYFGGVAFVTFILQVKDLRAAGSPDSVDERPHGPLTLTLP